MNTYWFDRRLFTNWEYQKDYILKLSEIWNLEDKEKIYKAVELVKRLHSEPRLDGVGIANVHLLRVPRILSEEMNEVQSDTIIIAVLHDILEDTSYSEEMLLKEFGIRILEGVKLLTRPREKDWAEYAREIFLSGNQQILKIKIADKLDNTRSLAMSNNQRLRNQDIHKTVKIMKPIIDIHYPEFWFRFDEVLRRWN